MARGVPCPQSRRWCWPADQASKSLAEAAGPGGGGDGLVSVRLVRNSGASFRIGTGHSLLITLTAAAVLAFTIVLLARPTGQRTEGTDGHSRTNHRAADLRTHSSAWLYPKPSQQRAANEAVACPLPSPARTRL